MTETRDYYEFDSEEAKEAMKLSTSEVAEIFDATANAKERDLSALKMMLHERHIEGFNEGLMSYHGYSADGFITLLPLDTQEFMFKKIFPKGYIDYERDPLLTTPDNIYDVANVIVYIWEDMNDTHWAAKASATKVYDESTDSEKMSYMERPTKLLNIAIGLATAKALKKLNFGRGYYRPADEVDAALKELAELPSYRLSPELSEESRDVMTAMGIHDTKDAADTAAELASITDPVERKEAAEAKKAGSRATQKEMAVQMLNELKASADTICEQVSLYETGAGSLEVINREIKTLAKLKKELYNKLATKGTAIKGAVTNTDIMKALTKLPSCVHKALDSGDPLTEGDIVVKKTEPVVAASEEVIPVAAEEVAEAIAEAAEEAKEEEKKEELPAAEPEAEKEEVIEEVTEETPATEARNLDRFFSEKVEATFYVVKGCKICDLDARKLKFLYSSAKSDGVLTEEDRLDILYAIELKEGKAAADAIAATKK